MRTTRIQVLGLGLLVLGCARPIPNLEPPPAPLAVRVSLQAEGPLEAGAERAWAEGFRDALSGQADILPEGVEVSDAAVLDIRVEPVHRGEAVARSAKSAAGRGFGVGWDAIQTDSNKLQDRLAAGVVGAFAGALCAVVVAPVQAAATETAALAHQARLGYKPRHVFVACRYTAPGKSCQLLLETRALDVVKRMRPMSLAEAREPGRLAREEARAAALLLSERLEAAGWRRSRPRGDR